jgi:hypothetical protein
MNVIKSEQVICVDIDQTLVLHGKVRKGQRAVTVTNPHTKEQKIMRVHEPHIKIITERLARGATLIVWSAGGHAWAEAVLKALKISHPNIFVFSKSVAYVDDKRASQFMGEHINMDPDDDYR